MYRDTEVTVRDVQNRVTTLIQQTPALVDFVEKIAGTDLHAWLFGGAVRSAIYSHPPRDLDIILTGDRETAEQFIKDLAKEWSHTKKYAQDDSTSNVESVVFEHHDAELDVWHISTQRNVRNVQQHLQTIERVAATTYLTSDSILVNLEDRRVVDAGALKCLNERVLDCRKEVQEPRSRRHPPGPDHQGHGAVRPAGAQDDAGPQGRGW